MTGSEVAVRGPWSKDEAWAFLEGAVIPLRLAVTDGSGWPLVLSLWFVADGDELLVATRPTSVVAQRLAEAPRCAFEVAGDQPPYRGVRGRAEVTIDRGAGAATLTRLLERYLGGTDSPLAARLLRGADDEVCLRLRPVSLVSWDYRGRMAASLPRGRA
jgi:nitroimidazol reductase NimA-like FMN-containing flavoprotein (pyridoxamine 5'-phosphate oxidase superfamily)